MMMDTVLKIGRLTDPVFRAEIAAKTGGVCTYCGMRLGEKYDIDHFHAKSMGGKSTFANLMPACEDCNGSKGKMKIEEWRISLARKRYREKVGMPYFSKQQREYLESIGLDVYANIEPRPFWFEAMGFTAANDNETSEAA
jgi:hypothetical protein